MEKWVQDQTVLATVQRLRERLDRLWPLNQPLGDPLSARSQISTADRSAQNQSSLLGSLEFRNDLRSRGLRSSLTVPLRRRVSSGRSGPAYVSLMAPVCPPPLNGTFNNGAVLHFHSAEEVFGTRQS